MKLSSRQFVKCPFNDEDFGKISPRSFQPFRTRDLCNVDGSYFADSVINSFPDIIERVNFLNKFYQCLLCFQLPHKTRKLVVVGDRDSGKTSWANVLFGIIPEAKTAMLSKEKNFGASMISDDTELLYVDEWNSDMMTSDLLKTLLQGGSFPQSIKHATPRIQKMNAGVYMTCNILPSFGNEDDNVKRRLSIFKTKALEVKHVEAPKWMLDNAFTCVVWMINVINSNVRWVDPEERFYELAFNTPGNAKPEKRVSAVDLDRIQTTFLEEERLENVALDESIYSIFDHGNPGR